VVEPQRGDRHDADAVVVDQERVLVRAVGRASVLHDPQPPRGALLLDAVVEQDHAVGHVLLEPLAGERAVAALARDHGGDAPVLEPAEQPPQLGPQDRVVREAAEQALDRVEHDALGAERVDRVAQPHEQAAEVVVAGLVDLAALDAHVVDQDALAPLELRQVHPERADVLGQLFPRLLEAHEDAGLPEARCAVHQELEREEGLAAARAATDQRWPSDGEAPARDLVQPLDARRRFGDRARYRLLLPTQLCTPLNPASGCNACASGAGRGIARNPRAGTTGAGRLFGRFVDGLESCRTYKVTSGRTGWCSGSLS
jgi:hypothetical protein